MPGVRPTRGRRRRRHDPPRPAEDERPQPAGAGGDPRRGRARPTERDDVRAVVVYGGEKVFAAGADVKEMAEHVATPTWSSAPAGLQSGVHRGRPDPQAGRRRGHRLRARRRLRARALRRRPDRRRQRHARPAGDPARHHPRRRRHPAAGPPGRPEPRQGPDLHRPLRQGRRGAAPSAWSTGSSPPSEVYDEAVAWAAQFSRRRVVRPAGRQGGRSTAASRSTSTPAWRSSASSSRPCSPPRTARIGMHSFVENGPGKAAVRGPLTQRRDRDCPQAAHDRGADRVAQSPDRRIRRRARAHRNAIQNADPGPGRARGVAASSASSPLFLALGALLVALARQRQPRQRPGEVRRSTCADARPRVVQPRQRHHRASPARTPTSKNALFNWGLARRRLPGRSAGSWPTRSPLSTR